MLADVKETDKLFLGLDCSTQTLKAIIIKENLEEVYVRTINYDIDLPHHKTQGGAHIHEDHLTVTTPTIVWLEALDMLFLLMKHDLVPFSQIVSISGSGQQHGSVFWKKGAEEMLANMKSGASIASQLGQAFSIPDSPIWMDSSTRHECDLLEKAFGGPSGLASASGSCAYERFTGNQIHKQRRVNQSKFDTTERISLVSSFLASIFLGAYARIDGGDAAGMNIMDINSREWLDTALDVVYPGKAQFLKQLLGKVVQSHELEGKISKYFVQEYGFSADCLIIPFSGDNPCSVAGLKLSPGNIAISLGTSDVLFGPLEHINSSSAEGSVMCDPVNPNGHMILLCFKNGSLTREFVRNEVADKNWATFDQLLAQSPAGNNGQIGLFFVQPEITPIFNHKGIYRFDKDGKSVEKFEPAAEVRSVIEGHFLSMYAHAKKQESQQHPCGLLVAPLLILIFSKLLLIFLECK
eukprot:TRINITY_DN5070_c0_g1_i1.p1 TRINITY_DN5070_c0_g1~~TRINITY_DN5070_c0_g1_i1.p1  ORF type:complete len:482 (-),score=116.43 TRINITY_DN5070_c0_g1_i1:269-1666(-)